jgi:hypothetical protein
MRWLRPGSEAEMIALFLRTELPSARWQDGLPLTHRSGYRTGTSTVSPAAAAASASRLS